MGKALKGHGEEGNQTKDYRIFFNHSKLGHGKVDIWEKKIKRYKIYHSRML